MAGASRPPGRALAYVVLAERESGDLVAAGGEKQCFSFSARWAVWSFPIDTGVVRNECAPYWAASTSARNPLGVWPNIALNRRENCA
jgi:hypothetical protein